MDNAMGEGELQPAYLRNCSTDFDGSQTLELSPNDHPPRKFHFDTMMWVVSAIPRFLSLSFFFGLFITCTGHTGGPILTIYKSYDICLPKDVPLGDSLICIPI